MRFSSSSLDSLHLKKNSTGPVATNFFIFLWCVHKYPESGAGQRKIKVGRTFRERRRKEEEKEKKVMPAATPGNHLNSHACRKLAA